MKRVIVSLVNEHEATVFGFLVVLLPEVSIILDCHGAMLFECFDYVLVLLDRLLQNLSILILFNLVESIFHFIIVRGDALVYVRNHMSILEFFGFAIVDGLLFETFDPQIFGTF